MAGTGSVREETPPSHLFHHCTLTPELAVLSPKGFFSMGEMVLHVPGRCTTKLFGREQGSAGRREMDLSSHLALVQRSDESSDGGTARQRSIKLGFSEASRQPKTGHDTPVAEPGDGRDLVPGQAEDEESACSPDR